MSYEDSPCAAVRATAERHANDRSDLVRKAGLHEHSGKARCAGGVVLIQRVRGESNDRHARVAEPGQQFGRAPVRKPR